MFPKDALFSATEKVYSDNDFTYVRQLVLRMKEVWAQASKNLEEAQEKYKKQYDKRARVRNFEKGCLVLRAAPEMINTKHVPSKFHAYFDHLFRVVDLSETDLKLEPVLPPKTTARWVPKQHCKIFRGTVRDYDGYARGNHHTSSGMDPSDFIS